MGYSKRVWPAALLLAAVCWGTAPARADLRDAPPAPTISFSVQPQFHVVPGSRVYLWTNASAGYDMYRFGNTYYINDGGWWYRADSMRGPYTVIETATVPRAVVMAYNPDYSGNSSYNNNNNNDNNRYNANYDRDNDRDYDRAPMAPRVVLSDQPRFIMVPGTSASLWINGPSDYQVYRFNGTYYLNSNGWWYRSSDLRGQWDVVADASIPVQVTRASDYRMRNGDRWAYSNRRYGYGMPAPRYGTASGVLALAFREQPRFVKVPGTDVEWCVNMRDYDLYRFHGDYFVSDNGTWFSSDHVRGPYRVMRQQHVPGELYSAADYRSQNGDDWIYNHHWHRHGHL